MANEKKMSANTKPPTTDPRGRCGTSAGYQAHRRRGEKACEACITGHTDANRRRASGEKVETKPTAARKRHVPIEQQGAEPIVNTPSVPKPSANPFNAATATPAPTPPPRAKATPTPQVPEGVPAPPDWLKARGLELWIEVNQAHTLNASALILLGEACRTADRLERLAAALSSRSTMWFELGDLDQATELGIPIVVNGMIGEARQLQTSLRQTLTTLGVVNVDAANKVAKSPLDQLAEKRQQRLAAQGGA